MANIVDMMAMIQQIDAVNNRSGEFSWTYESSTRRSYTGSDFINAHGFVILNGNINPSLHSTAIYYVGLMVDVVNDYCYTITFRYAPYSLSYLQYSEGTMSERNVFFSPSIGKILQFVK